MEKTKQVINWDKIEFETTEGAVSVLGLFTEYVKKNPELLEKYQPFSYNK